MEKDKLIKMLIGFLPLLLLFLDPPEGMDPKAWGLFPFYAGAILMVMLRPVGEATALAIFLGLYAVMMRGHTVALSGFALTMTWLVVGAYIIAQAFRDTNLGKRISFWMIRIFGRSTLGLGYAAAFADFIIAPVTPSNAARTGGHLSHLPQRRGIFGFLSRQKSPGLWRLHFGSALCGDHVYRHHVPNGVCCQHRRLGAGGSNAGTAHHLAPVDDCIHSARGHRAADRAIRHVSDLPAHSDQDR